MSLSNWLCVIIRSRYYITIIMIIRELHSSDLNQLRAIHARFFSDEFELPDFFNKFLCSFVVVNEEENVIITAGGVRTIAESVIITNKHISPETRREALYRMLEASAHITNSFGYEQLHAFIQNDKWKKHLEKVGFNKCKGEAVYLNV